MFVLAGSLARADAFDDAAAAYKRGDYAAAAPLFESLAVRGDHRAMAALGSMHAAGQGVEQSHRDAFRWFREAAKYNRADAQYRLGLMYDAGLGIRADQRKAVRWYQKAARQGYVHAYVMMGLKYLEGEGLPQDDVKAYAWLSLARPALSQAAPVADAVTDGALDPAEVLAKLGALEQRLDAAGREAAVALARRLAPSPAAAP